MAQIPERLPQAPPNYGRFRLVHQGKVRDTYSDPINRPEQLIVVASDRLSAFDFVLPIEVPQKGEILTALTHFWITLMEKWSQLPHHLLLSAQGDHLNSSVNFADTGVPAKRTLAVKRLKMHPFELIFRRHLGGSVWKEYHDKGTAGGNLLPQNLKRWEKLDPSVFTPSTKEVSGHDINITAKQYFDETGGMWVVEQLRELYAHAYEYAAARNVLIFDAKFEVGEDNDGVAVLADEILTPDCARMVLREEFEKSQQEGRDPAFLDKEEVRKWCRTVATPFYNDGHATVGIHQLDPKNAEHLAFVHQLEVPEEVVNKTSQNYRELFTALTGCTLEQYQREIMGIT